MRDKMSYAQMQMLEGDRKFKESLENKIKGEKKLLKIIVKNKETGEQRCVDIPKEREQDSDIVNLKVGMTVYYQAKMGCRPELVEIVKIIDTTQGVVFRQYDGGLAPYPNWNPWTYARRAGRATFTREYLDKLREQNEERQDRKEYRKKPYFLVRLDTMRGTDVGEENLEKIKFPCWVTYRYTELGKDRIGMLVTGSPGTGLEYQLIDMMKQVPVGDVCTEFRDTDLKALMDKCNIKVIKGESQLYKIGRFNV